MLVGSKPELKATLQKVVSAHQYDYGSSRLGWKIKRSLGAISSPSNCFFVETQIRRLSKPCSRLIDLRPFSSVVEFEHFEHEGMEHILDAESKQEFHRLLDAYNGEYTFGVYEGVISNFKLNKESIRANQDTYTNITISPLQNVFSRSEERMNLGVRIHVVDVSNDFKDLDAELLNHKVSTLPVKGKPYIEAVTSNISLSGLKFKSKKAYATGSIVLVRFTDFEKEFCFKQKYIAYRVVASLSENDFFYTALSQLSLPCHSEFVAFSKRLIFANKRRYKVSIDNTVRSVESKALEQLYLSRNESLYVLNDGQGEVSHAVYSDASTILLGWFGHFDKSQLPSLILKDRLFDNVETGKSSWWVVVRRRSADGSHLFFSTLISDDLSARFAVFACNSEDAYIFKVARSQVSERSAFITSSLPREVHRELGGEDVYRYSPQLHKQAAKFSDVLSITPVSIFRKEKVLLSDAQLTKANVQACNSYALRRDRFSCLNASKIESSEFRKEDRFHLSTPIVVSVNGKMFEGVTLDVSVHGIAIKANDEMILRKGDVLACAFPELAVKEADFDLKKVFYKVISCKGNVIRAEALNNKGFVGVAFFDKFIAENIDNLKVVGSAEPHYGMRRMFRNIAAHAQPTIPAFFTKKDGNPVVRKVSLSDCLGGNAKAFFSEHHGETSKAFRDVFFSKSVLSQVSKILHSKDKDMNHSFVMAVVSKGHEVSGVFVSEENIPLDAIKKFSDQTEGSVSVFNVSVASKIRTFSKYYRDELRYLEDYSLFKAQRLNNQIASLIGYLDLTDITDLYEMFTCSGKQ